MFRRVRHLMNAWLGVLLALAGGVPDVPRRVWHVASKAHPGPARLEGQYILTAQGWRMVPAGADDGGITTEAELDDLLNDKQRLHDYIAGVAKEQMGAEVDTIGQTVKTQVESILHKGGVNRLPMATSEPEDETKYKNFGEFLKSVWSAQRGDRGTEPDVRLANYIATKLLSEGVGADGGFLVPEEFRATLLELAVEEAVIRPRAFVVPMGLPVLNIPAVHDTSHASNLFGGVSAKWNAEGADISSDETDPVFRQVRLDAKKLTGYTRVSNELMMDAPMTIEAVLNRMFATALAYFEDDAFIAGTGVGQPLGLKDAPANVSVSKETGQAATTIVAENLDKMYSRMLPQSRNRAIWLAHPDTFPQLASLSRAVGTGGSAVWVTNIANGPPSTIYGRPVVFTEKCETLGTAGDIYFVDLNFYLIGDRQAFTVSTSPHVKFVNDETVWRFIQRVDGRPWITSALTPRNGTNTLSPIVSLATRS